MQNAQESSQSETVLRELMMKAQAGDRESYRQLLTTLRPMAIRVASAILKSTGRRAEIDVEDIAQDAMLSIHKNLRTYLPENPFTPWFNAIVRHRTIDILRGHKIYVSVTELDSRMNASEIQDEQAELDISKQELQNLLDQLPPKLRQVLHLSKVEGHSVAEVAKILEISESDVKVSTFRAIQSLKKSREVLK